MNELVSQEVSTLYLEKGDFVRFQNATLGYNVPLSGSGTFKTLRFSFCGAPWPRAGGCGLSVLALALVLWRITTCPAS